MAQIFQIGDENMTIDYKALKEGGFMRQKDAGYFSLRLHLVGGQIDADKMIRIAELSKKYGKGYLHLTTRQGVEIPYVHLDKVTAIKAELAEAGVETGVCGPRVRTVIACQGEEVCPRGMIDCQDIGQKIDKKYYGQKLPHKFKFAVTGCPAGCAKPEENDIGVQGAIHPKYDSDGCSMCGLCQEVCYSGAIEVTEDTVEFDDTKCNLCGECVKSCPMDCWRPEVLGYILFVGGKMGKKPRLADALPFIIDSEDELFSIIDVTLEFFNKHGKPRERFGTTLDRVGLKKLMADIEKLA